MKRSEIREVIAAVASKVGGVTCEAYYKPNQKPGWGYVELLRTGYPNVLGGEDYWGVVITLPNDGAAAQKWQDDHQELLVVALMDELEVTEARGETHVQTDNPAVKVLVVEGHREGER